MTQDEHNPEGTDRAAQGHALAASKKYTTPADDLPARYQDAVNKDAEAHMKIVFDATPPAPALPQEVREAIERAFTRFFGAPLVGDEQIMLSATCAALAPLWPRPAAVTEDAAAIWEKAFDAYCKGTGDATSHERAAAALAPVLAERDRLRAELLKFATSASSGSQSEVSASERAAYRYTVATHMATIADLRAQLRTAEGALAAAQKDRERMADLLDASLRYIPANAFYGNFATMTKEQGSLVRQVRAAIDAARREGGRHD